MLDTTCMDRKTFSKFDTACMQGDLVAIQELLGQERLTQSQLNEALRHAAYYTAPDEYDRAAVIDLLIDHGAIVDWSDRGRDTIKNAVKAGETYVLKRVLNACDGDKDQLESVVRDLQGKSYAGWALDLVQRRATGPLYVGI